MEISEEELEAVLAEWDRKAPSDGEVDAFLSGRLDAAIERPADYAHPGVSWNPVGDEAAWVSVDGSTNVGAVAYWRSSTPGAVGTLGMRFSNGGEYHYPGVPEYLFRALLGARSKGISHWELIRRRGYLAIRIKPPRKNWRRTAP